MASEPRANAMLRDVRTLLEAGAEPQPRHLGGNGVGEPAHRGVVLSVYGMPGSDEVGHVAALESNLVALVVPRGGRVKNVRRALESLESSSQATSDLSSAKRRTPTSLMAESGTTWSGV